METPPPDGAALVMALAQALRAERVEVSISSELLCTRAVALVGLDDIGRVHAAARTALVHRPEDADAFDRAFDSVFVGQARVAPRRPEPPVLHVTLHHDAPSAQELDAGWEVEDSPEDLTLRFSAVEILRSADLATLTAEEMAQANAMISALLGSRRRLGPFRRGRRTRPGRSGSAVDLRRTVAGALARDGEIVTLARRRRVDVPRRLVLLVDVSGSMEVYARAMLRFAHVLVAARPRVEVFAMGTRLSRLSRALSSHDPDLALARATDEVPDYGGGTRLGEALAEFNDRWGLRGTARGAVVVVLSDGWDRGDPALVAEQMQRLRRVAHRIIWVNPLAADATFAPLAGGMAAALPFVDDLRAGHSVGSLAALLDTMTDALAERRGEGRGKQPLPSDGTVI